jgi:hypothetical protein
MMTLQSCKETTALNIHCSQPCRCGNFSDTFVWRAVYLWVPRRILDKVKMQILRNVTPCNLVDGCRRFRKPYRLRDQEEESTHWSWRQRGTSETLVDIYYQHGVRFQKAAHLTFLGVRNSKHALEKSHVNKRTASSKGNFTENFHVIFIFSI